MQVCCDWQVTLCDPHLSALEVRFSRRCAIQIDVYLYLTLPCVACCKLNAILSACVWLDNRSQHAAHVTVAIRPIRLDSILSPRYHQISPLYRWVSTPFRYCKVSASQWLLILSGWFWSHIKMFSSSSSSSSSSSFYLFRTIRYWYLILINIYRRMSHLYDYLLTYLL